MEQMKLKDRLSAKVQTLQTTPALPSSDYLALNGSTLDLIHENLKDQPLTYKMFDIVKSPSGGSTVFTVPGLAGEEAEKELTGIILDYTLPRAYWSTPDPVEGTPPTCLSHNSLVSESGKPCARCPFNDYGSKDGETGAKACKESVLLFLLRPGSVFPLLVRVPVTSKKCFLKYTTRLISRMTPLSSVVTKITLEKATSREGKPYALFHFDAVQILDQETAAKAREFGKQFMEFVNAADVEPVFTQAS